MNPSTLNFAKGYLLESLKIPDTTMGIDYERGIGICRKQSESDRCTIVWPRGACRVRITDLRAEPFEVSGTQLLYLPHHQAFRIEATSALYDVLFIRPNSRYMEDVVTDNHLANDQMVALNSKRFLLQRSRWMDDIVERYYFERVVNHASPPGCTFFLEKQMLNELVRLMFVGTIPTIGPMIGEQSSEITERAIKYIESHLFEKLDLKSICNHLKCTTVTLNRAFKNALGLTPAVYIKHRKLDESALLIESGEYQISDVCMLIGYEDLASFSKAFKERFGISPSRFRSDGARKTDNFIV
jgi:AraC-like DNA-binding protein